MLGRTSVNRSRFLADDVATRRTVPKGLASDRSLEPSHQHRLRSARYRAANDSRPDAKCRECLATETSNRSGISVFRSYQ